MKKVLVLLLALTLTLSMSLSAVGASDKANNGKGKGAIKSEIQTAAELSDKALLKQFKMEMNLALKGLDTLQSDKDALELEVDALLIELLSPELDPPLAAELQASIDNLSSQISDIEKMLANPEAAKKQLINERFMIIKSVKSGFALSEFDNAEALIAAMYTAAQDEEKWSYWTNNSGNLIKLEGPMYLKGSKIMFPVKALENMGATVEAHPENKTVNIIGANGVTLVFSYNGTTASTQADVEMGTFIGPLSYDFVVSEATSGNATISGTVPCTVTNPLTNPLTSEPLEVLLAIEATAANLVENAGGVLDGGIAGTLSGDIIDPITSEVLGTVTGIVGGTLLDPTFALDSDTTTFAVPFESEINCGRAYVPLKDIADVFALDIVADTIEDTITVEPAVQAEGTETEGATTEAI